MSRAAGTSAEPLDSMPAVAKPLSTKQWGGRFAQPTDPLVERFTGSVAVDGRMILHDIAGSIAHVRMLGRQGILAAGEAAAIEAGLQAVQADYEAGMPLLDTDLEDVHTVVEVALRRHVGELAGKLHTARSRNDQVALDLRLFTRQACVETMEAIADLENAFVEQGRACLGLIMPGYTHLQRAQPVLVTHHLLAYVEMLQRDVQRFAGCFTRADVLPLGSGALAGVPYPVDRQWLAAELGMAGVAQNSIDAVADRDFAIEFCAAAATAMMHLSRFAEETVLWCSSEFAFWDLDDSFATGSSIMPQKKNPDVAELIRGKTGRVYGDLQALLTLMKGLPLAYNRDMQEDKVPLFDAADTLAACLEACTGLVRALRPNATTMANAAGNLVCATDVADYLVGKGLPFRDAHAVTGSLVRLCLATGTALQDLDLASYRKASPLFDVTIYDHISPLASVSARSAEGGTAPAMVKNQLDRVASLVTQNRILAHDLAGREHASRAV
jgi:argininosuccinate lyase